MNFSQIIANKTETIIDEWIEAVQQDQEITSAKKLAYESVRDSIPFVLKAIATLLAQDSISNVQIVVQESLEHGCHRAKQDYDAAEIVREYRLLREVIFATLETELLASSASEILSGVRAINSVLDWIISLSVESYINERLQDLEQVQHQLLLTNQELNRLAESHQENVSHLAHELKNPLNAIMGFTQMLLRQQQNSSAQTPLDNIQLIERVVSNSRQLLRLINDTLEISRCEAGQIKLNLEAITPQPIIEEVIEALKPSAYDKNLAISVNCDRAPKQVTTDPLRLCQIITNLVSNAIRYTETGEVRVTCQVLPDTHWAIAVADTGVGIKPEDQDKIFSPYFQVGSSGSQSPDSTGLGLAIVVKLVELLQGNIKLISEFGSGSTFIVEFPISR